MHLWLVHRHICRPVPFSMYACVHTGLRLFHFSTPRESLTHFARMPEPAKLFSQLWTATASQIIRILAIFVAISPVIITAKSHNSFNLLPHLSPEISWSVGENGRCLRPAGHILSRKCIDHLCAAEALASDTDRPQRQRWCPRNTSSTKGVHIIIPYSSIPESRTRARTKNILEAIKSNNCRKNSCSERRLSVYVCMSLYCVVRWLNGHVYDQYMHACSLRLAIRYCIHAQPTYPI